jgi:hypothetical protein
MDSYVILYVQSMQTHSLMQLCKRIWDMAPKVQSYVLYICHKNIRFYMIQSIKGQPGARSSRLHRVWERV